MSQSAKRGAFETATREWTASQHPFPLDDTDPNTPVEGLFRNPMRSPRPFAPVRSPETDPSVRQVLRTLVETFESLGVKALNEALPDASRLYIERYGASSLGGLLRTKDWKVRGQFNRVMRRETVFGQDVQVRAYYLSGIQSGVTPARTHFYDRGQRPVVFRLSGVPGSAPDPKQRLDVVGRLATGLQGDDTLIDERSLAYVSERELDGGRTEFVALIFADTYDSKPLTWVLVGTRPTALPSSSSTVGAPRVDAQPGRVRPQYVALLAFDSDERYKVLLLHSAATDQVRLPGGRIRGEERPWRALQRHYRATIGKFLPPMVPLGADDTETPGLQTFDLWDGTMRVYVGRLRASRVASVPNDAITSRHAMWLPWKDGYGNPGNARMPYATTPATEALLDALAEEGAFRAPVQGLIRNVRKPLRRFVPLASLEALSGTDANAKTDARVLTTLVEEDVRRQTPKGMRKALVRRFSDLAYGKLEPADNNGVLQSEIFNQFGLRIARAKQPVLITPLVSIEEPVSGNLVVRVSPERASAATQRRGTRRLALVAPSPDAPMLAQWFQEGGRQADRNVEIKLQQTSEVFGRSLGRAAATTFASERLALNTSASEAYALARTALGRGEPLLMATRLGKGGVGRFSTGQNTYLVLEFDPIAGASRDAAAKDPGNLLTLRRLHLYTLRNAE